MATKTERKKKGKRIHGGETVAKFNKETGRAEPEQLTDLMLEALGG